MFRSGRLAAPLYMKSFSFEFVRHLLHGIVMTACTASLDLHKPHLQIVFMCGTHEQLVTGCNLKAWIYSQDIWILMCSLPLGMCIFQYVLH